VQAVQIIPTAGFKSISIYVAGEEDLCGTRA
jgi:hypothetical protein